MWVSITAAVTCPQASCLLRSSRWTCVCDDGFSGDGHVCYGTVEQVRPTNAEVKNVGVSARTIVNYLC